MANPRHGCRRFGSAAFCGAFSVNGRRSRCGTFGKSQPADCMPSKEDLSWIVSHLVTLRSVISERLTVQTFAAHMDAIAKDLRLIRNEPRRVMALALFKDLQ